MNKFVEIQSVMRELATSAAMGCAYPKWTDEDYKHKHNMGVWKNTRDGMRQIRQLSLTAADIFALSEDELNSLGFGKWDETGLRLIPLYIWNYIADGEILHCIDGGTEIKGSNEIDLDVRFGAIAYGFLPSPVE